MLLKCCDYEIENDVFCVYGPLFLAEDATSAENNMARSNFLLEDPSLPLEADVIWSNVIKDIITHSLFVRT